MATYTDNGTNTPNGIHKVFEYTFPVSQTEYIKVALNGIVQATTKYTASLFPAQIVFNDTSIDSSVQENTGAPKEGVQVRVFRETTVGTTNGDEDPKAYFAAGSSIRAVDLNANQTQALDAIHELQTQPIKTSDVEDGAITSAKIKDDSIVNADIKSDAAIDGTKVNPSFGSQNISTTGNLSSGNITITGTEARINFTDTSDNPDYTILANYGLFVIADATNNVTRFQINSDGHIDLPGNVDIGSADITGNLDVDGTTTLDGTTVDGVLDVNGSTTIDNVQIDGNEIDTTSGNLTIDSHGGTTTVDDALTVTGQLKANDSLTVNTDLVFRKIGNDFFIDNAHDANSPQSNLYIRNNFGSGIDHSGDIHIQAKAGEEGIVVFDDGAVALYTNGAVQFTTTLNTAFGNLSNAHMSPQSNNTFDLGTDDLRWRDIHVNDIKGDSIVTSGESTSDSKVYSAKHASSLFRTEVEVNAQLVNLVDAVGGFVPLTDEGEIPQLHPETANTVTANRVGTILSIGLIDKTGGYTTANGRRSGTTVTIEASDLTNHAVNATITNCSVDLPEGSSVLVETTAQTNAQYADGPSFKFHRLLPKPDEVTTVATNIGSVNTIAGNILDINYFANRYSTGSSDPSTNLNEGDLHFDTGTDKLKVYTGSAWQEITTLNNAGGAVAGDITFTTNTKLQLGGSGDLQISHDGSQNLINSYTSNPLNIISNGDTTIKTNNNEKMAVFKKNNAVELYWDGNPKLATTTAGIDVDGSVTADDIITAGALLHEGDTNTLVHFTANDEISLKTNGSTRLKAHNGGIDITGSLGISGDTTFTSGSRHKFIGGGSGNNLELGTYSSSNSSRDVHLTIDSAGQIGIGTAIPGALLHLKSDDPVIRLHDTSSDRFGQIVGIDGNLRFDADNSNAQANTNIAFRTDGTERVNIDSSGATVSGNLTVSSAAPKIYLTDTGDNPDYVIKNNNGTIQINDETNGATRLSIDSSGNTTLTTGAHDAGLDILAGGNSQSTNLKIQAKDNSGNEHNWNLGVARSVDRFSIDNGVTSYFNILDGGNVGIGELSPQSKLHVKIDDTGIAPHASAQICLERAGTNYLQFLTANNGTSGLLFGDADDVDVTQIKYDHNTKKLSFVTETDTALTIDESQKVGIGHDTPSSFSSGANTLVLNTDSGNCGLTISTGAADQTGSIFFAEGTGSTGDGRIRYEHANNAMVFSTADTERMRINSSGNVGINDTSPSVTLDITGEGGGNGEVHVKRTSGASCFIQAQSATAVFGSNTNHKVQLKSNGTTALTIDTSQRIGIGTTSPNQKLSIDSAGVSDGIHLQTTSGSHYLVGIQTADNFITGATAGSLGIRSNNAIHFSAGGATERLRITSSGAGVTGNLEVGSGQITCGVHGTTGIQIINDGTFGTLHNVDLTFRTASATRATIDTSGNFNIPNDSGKIRLGASQDLQIYHDGSFNRIASDVRTDIIKITGSEHLAKFIPDGAVELFYDNSKKLSTISTGVAIGTDGTQSDQVLSGSNISASLVLDPTENSTGAAIALNNVGLTGNYGIVSRANSSSGQAFAVFYNSSGTGVGSIASNNSATVFATSSDYRIKENAVDITDGLTRLKQLKPYRFNFKQDTSKIVDGFFAHEAQTVVPEAVTGTKDEVDSSGEPVVQGIDQSKLVPLLTAALQEAIAKIEVLETKVAALEAA